MTPMSTTDWILTVVLVAPFALLGLLIVVVGLGAGIAQLVGTRRARKHDPARVKGMILRGDVGTGRRVSR